MLTRSILRYLKATLICGGLAAITAIGLYELGAFTAWDHRLAIFLNQGVPVPVRRLSEYGFIGFFAFGIAWTSVDIARFSLKTLIAALALFEIITATWAFAIYDSYYSPFGSLAAVTVAFIAGTIYSLTKGGHRKQELHELFGDRVSEPTFNALLDANAPLNYQGEVRQATIVVCEIFNHDELLSALSTKDYVEMTNVFLRKSADFLVERGGYLDECDGESLRVLYGVPLADPRHATRACDAALELIGRLEALNKECESRWKATLDFRIGINSGEVVFASYGTKRLFGVTISGEPVEFARRLCAANTIYESRLLIGSGTFKAAETDIEVRPMELIQRHRDDPTKEEVYELLARHGQLSADDATRRDLFWKGIVFFREQKLDDALTHFRLARELAANDGPCDFYIQRIEQIRAGTTSLDWSKG